MRSDRDKSLNVIVYERQKWFDEEIDMIVLRKLWDNNVNG